MTVVALGGAFALAVPAPAYAPQLMLLNQIEKGVWTLKTRPSGTTRSICLRDGRELLALRHKTAGCSRYIVENTARELTVHMTCGTGGHARTTLRYETPRLIDIDTQGLVGGSPYSDTYEARRTGPCK